MKRRVFMEGGNAQSRVPRQEQRLDAQRLFTAIHNTNAHIEVVLGTDRDRAIKAFVVQSTEEGTRNLLLVDSEDPVLEDGALDHLRSQGKTIPVSADPADVHLMIQCMETWLVADPHGARRVVGALDPTKAARHTDLESMSVSDVIQNLKRASGGGYRKVDGLRAFGRLDPTVVSKRCPSAAVFFERLRRL
jgi:hypothetical protein